MIRNLEKREEFSKMELNDADKGFFSYKKPESFNLNRSSTFQSYNRNDKHRPNQKKQVKETENETEETLMKENSIDTKEINNPNTVEEKFHSSDVNLEPWKVISRRKKSSKQSNTLKESNISDKNENKSLSQNQHDRFKHSKRSRTYYDNYYQQTPVLINVSDRKATFSAVTQKKNSNFSKNGISSVVYSTDNPSKEIQNGLTNMDEASVKNCTSTVKNLNSTESFKEVIPEKSNSKTLEKRPRVKNPKKCQLKNENVVPNTSQTGQQNDKICASTTFVEENAFSNENTVDNVEQISDDNDNILKPKQCDSQEETLPKETDSDDIQGPETIQGPELNVHAAEFFPNFRPGYLTHVNQNLDSLVIYTTNSNYVRSLSLVFQWSYKGTTYFHAYPNCMSRDDSWFARFNQQRTINSWYCPYCHDSNSVNTS